MKRNKYNIDDEVKYIGRVWKIYAISKQIFSDDDVYYELYRDTSIDRKFAYDIPEEALKNKMESTHMTTDTVNHPSYYQGKIEVIDFIEDKKLGFNLGNCVKYISRCYLKHKDNPVEDLKKARWYLDREISRIEGAENK